MKSLLRSLPLLAAFALSAAASAAPGLGIRLGSFELGDLRANVALEVGLDLNETLRDALDGGVEVVFRLDMDVVEERWMFDRGLYGASWSSSMRRREYGQGYEYRRFGEEDWRNSDGVDSALSNMRDFRVILDDRGLLGDLQRPEVYVLHRVEVDLEVLPNPIKVELLTTPGWNFSSGWVRTWH